MNQMFFLVAAPQEYWMSSSSNIFLTKASLLNDWNGFSQDGSSNGPDPLKSSERDNWSKNSQTGRTAVRTSLEQNAWNKP